MKALSDLTKPTILFPRVCNYPFSALPLQQSPIPIPLLFTGEGEGTTNIKAAWVPGPPSTRYHSLYQEPWT